jgi:hypothetical protein
MPDKTFYTESACDACPRHCRAGVFVVNGGDVRLPREDADGKRYCPEGLTPDWKPTEHGKRKPTHRLDTVTKVSAVHSGTVLLGCVGCTENSPCLYEITGPARAPGCIALGHAAAKWHHVTE